MTGGQSRKVLAVNAQDYGEKACNAYQIRLERRRSGPSAAGSAQVQHACLVETDWLTGFSTRRLSSALAIDRGYIQRILGVSVRLGVHGPVVSGVAGRSSGRRWADPILGCRPVRD
jgi:hypothetical protein